MPENLIALMTDTFWALILKIKKSILSYYSSRNLHWMLKMIFLQNKSLGEEAKDAVFRKLKSKIIMYRYNLKKKLNNQML